MKLETTQSVFMLGIARVKINIHCPKGFNELCRVDVLKMKCPHDEGTYVCGVPTIFVTSQSYPYAILSEHVLEQSEIIYLVKFRHNFSIFSKIGNTGTK